ncbi:MAG: hypothetical protein JWP97_6162 [Labilithrix sp.]|nr:hypothetical protein [Labilithrix sp.]
MRRAYVAMLPLLLAACRPASSPAGVAADESAGSAVTTEEVTYEKLPDGTTRKHTTTTTRSVGPAPAAPARPADAFPADSLARYAVERLNAYRAQKGLPPLVYDARLSAFALQGSQRLARDHVPHANMAEHGSAQHFGSRTAENQGDPHGVPALDPDAVKSGQKIIDLMLKMMMDEGPGGGHHDNIMNPKLRRVGVGNAVVAGRFYMTHDFSD